MNHSFIPTTKVQRETKAVFASETPFQIVLNNNEINGMIINRDTAQALLDSDILEQIQEELWESKDPTTSQMIKEARSGKASDTITLKDFRTTHDL